jgi:hypothetical protein
MVELGSVKLLLLLIFVNEVNYFVDIAGKNRLNIMEAFIYSVVSYPILRKIVRTDFF